MRRRLVVPRKRAYCAKGHETFSCSVEKSDEYVRDAWDSCGVVFCEAPLVRIEVTS